MIAWVPWSGEGDPRQPQGRPVILRRDEVRATIGMLRRLQQRRAAGCPVSYTTDPEWLVDAAINRRAGWPDDPSGHRGSCMPVNGKFPKRAEGDGCMWQFVRNLNGSRWCPREIETRWLPRKIRERIAHRIRTADDY